jgi:hypothetical protein
MNTGRETQNRIGPFCYGNFTTGADRESYAIVQPQKERSPLLYLARESKFSQTHPQAAMLLVGLLVFAPMYRRLNGGGGIKTISKCP